MKRLILLLSLVVIANFHGNSQKLWEKVLSDSQFNRSDFKSSVLVNDTLLVISGHYNWLGCGAPLLYALNMEGDSLWMFSDSDPDPYFSTTTFVETDGSFIYTCGETLINDIVFGEEPLFIYKFNQHGEIVDLNAYFNAEISESSILPSGMDLLPEIGIVVFEKNYSSTRILKFDLDLNLIWDRSKNVVFDQVLFGSNGNIILRSQSAIHIADPDGEIISEIPLENPLINMLVLDTSVLAITDNEAWEIDLEQPVIVKNIQNPPVEGASFISAKVLNEHIWLLSADHENAYVENISAETTEIYTLPLPAYSVQDFEISPDKIILIGSYSPWLIGILAYGREQTNPLVEWPDVELSDFEISNIEVFYWGFNIIPDIISYYRFDTDVEITNYSDEPLNSSMLYSPRYMGWTCWGPGFYRDISNLDLPYQQSLNLDVGNSAFSVGNGEASISVCYQLIAPNGRMERNLENNSICKDYDFTDVETVAEAHEWKIFPNPVQNEFTIQSPGQVSFQYKLYGADGRIVMEDSAEQGLKTLNVALLPAGLYILVTEFDNQRMVSKILKQ